MHHVEAPWRGRSRRPRPLGAEPMPSVGSASIEPITINDDADIVKCKVCRGKSGCEMAGVLWFGKQVCTLCFNMNYSMLLLKEGELGEQGLQLNAALVSVLNNRWSRLRVRRSRLRESGLVSGLNNNDDGVEESFAFYNGESVALYDGEMMPAKS